MENGYRLMFRCYWLGFNLVRTANQVNLANKTFKTYGEALAALNEFKAYEQEVSLVGKHQWSVERWIEPL